METDTAEISRLARQRILRRIGGVFAGVLIVVTLLSNTLYNLTLPKVATEQPTSGKLTRMYEGSAFVEYAEVTELANPSNWKVERVLVRKGDRVRNGQALVRYDASEAEGQIEDARAAMSLLQLPLDRLQQDYIEAVWGGDPAAVSIAREALESTRINIKTQQRHIRELENKLAANRKLMAPFDGIVTDVGAKEGLESASGGADVRLAKVDRGFQFTLKVPDGIAGSLKAGGTVTAKSTEGGQRSVQGTIVRIELEGGQDGCASALSGEALPETPETASCVTVALDDSELLGGERVKASFTSQSKEDAMLVSTNAVRRDRSGTYVLVVVRRQGPLGNAFYVQRREVVVEDTDGAVSALKGDVYEQDRIVTESSQPLENGERVQMP